MSAASGRGPSQVGPYQIVRRLGAGGMGVVYLGHEQSSGAAAAVKLIRPEHAANPQLRARLRHEVAAARRVPRFCTAPVLAADLDAEPPWVATEYIDAPTLDIVLVEQGRLTGTDLETFAIGVAVALRAIHDHGVIHRDLKPSNIILSRFGPRVIDFGIARLEDHTQLTQAGGVIGTPTYMAPEQLLGQSLTTAVDIFAWASVLSSAATGRPPFGSGDQVMHAILHDQPDLGELAEPLRSLVVEALAKDPAARPTATELVERLSHHAEAATAQVLAAAAAAPPAPPPAAIPTAVPTPPAPSTPAPGRRLRRPAALLAAALGVALAAGIGAAVALTATWGDRDPTGAAPTGTAAPTATASAAAGAAVTDPSPTPSPVADPCLVGTWELTDSRQVYPYLADGVSMRLKGGRARVYFGPDGTVDEDYRETTMVGSKNGHRYRAVWTGTVRARYRTVGDMLLWSRPKVDLEWVVYIDGAEDNRGAGEAISAQPTYFCDDQQLILTYPDDNGTHEYERVSRD